MRRISAESSKIWACQNTPQAPFHSPMSAKPAGKSSTAKNNTNNRFEIKSAQLSVLALMVKSGEWTALAKDLLAQYGPDGESPHFFEKDALILDFSQAPEKAALGQFEKFRDALYACDLMPVAFRFAPTEWVASLESYGWAHSPDLPRDPEREQGREIVREVVREVVREIPGPVTMVIDKPLRSGQKVYARGGDLVVLAMVNQGAEVVADGNIHVYATLRGKAMAGARGNTQARIFSLCLEPELVSIAGVYRTSENPLPADIAGRAAQIRLSNDGQDRLIFESLKT